VDIAVCFFVGFFDGASYRNARVQDLEPTGIIDIFPKTLIALGGRCLWGRFGFGGLHTVRQPIGYEERTPSNK